jgi:hypothetical protein
MAMDDRRRFTNAPDTDCDNDMISPHGEWRGSTTEQQVRSGSEKNADAEAASVLTETQRQSEPIRLATHV